MNIELFADQLREGVKYNYPLTDPTMLAILRDLATEFDSMRCSEREVINTLFMALYPESEEE